ncbi:hypothetical protein JAAARDRAFT_203873 [Jaapia argillacea MUCL 33604]|uniref:Protein arginine methyltransferase NDUFAF7 n=1 Tax=Jaapia argillacea MUCL 33604 TaxID=933084 RepID=A0A067Q5B5_9AGAM|nr:hypothetical protein JAAARDRAFT_203873 [Jaapia argillacea MUCL 33604]
MRPASIGLARSLSKRPCSRLGLSSTFSSFSPTRNDTVKRKPTDKINYNDISFNEDPNVEHVKYRPVTANELEKHSVPPRKVKMLVRDFIEDSLYNPHYGYFPKQAVILDSPAESFDFPSLRTAVEFQEEVAQRYSAYGSDQEGPGRQIWHTPTELFKPWYGQAVAQCLVSEYLLKYFPYEDFVIYEIGAGNGTLALNILDYIRDEYPEVYDRTRYHIAEISGRLAKIQRKRLCSVHNCVRVEHKSVFHWNKRETAPCFFIAMEVVDNFAHDMIRYDLRTLQPKQAWISIDGEGDFGVHYTRVTDPLISSLLSVRRQLSHGPPISPMLKASPLLRKAFVNLPFAPNLSKPEFIPTRLLNLMLTLRNYFPRHRLLLSDFSSLPDTIPGYNAPVVQTRFRNTTVACSTILVKQGYFDIFFPTNFEQLRDMYEFVLAEPVDSSKLSTASRSLPLTTNASSLSLGSAFFSSQYPSNRRPPMDGVVSASGLPVGEHKSSVFTHAEFLQTYADLSKTRLRNGENPMLDFYQNVKFLF